VDEAIQARKTLYFESEMPPKQATASALAAEGRDYRIVEKDAARVRDPAQAVIGDAAELGGLTQAGIQECAAIVVTTHDDDMNVYLTLCCRRLRADVQILSRSSRERNLSTLHRAGAAAKMQGRRKPCRSCSPATGGERPKRRSRRQAARGFIRPPTAPRRK
jgi:Trk K+ transport system NAD-binding subunit